MSETGGVAPVVELNSKGQPKAPGLNILAGVASEQKPLPEGGKRRRRKHRKTAKRHSRRRRTHRRR